LDSGIKTGTWVMFGEKKDQGLLEQIASTVLSFGSQPSVSRNRALNLYQITRLKNQQGAKEHGWNFKIETTRGGGRDLVQVLLSCTAALFLPFPRDSHVLRRVGKEMWRQ